MKNATSVPADEDETDLINPPEQRHELAEESGAQTGDVDEGTLVGGGGGEKEKRKERNFNLQSVVYYGVVKTLLLNSLRDAATGTTVCLVMDVARTVRLKINRCKMLGRERERV